MGNRVSGFTVIEVMLFLGISGLLMVGLMAGIGQGLNEQRYSDAVQDLKNTLQDQFAAMTSVQNNRSARTLTCNTFGAIVAAPSGSNESRGQSECVIVGRYLVIRGSEVSSYPITAYKKPPLSSPPADDVARILAQYALNLDTRSMSSTKLEWGAQLAWPTEGPYARNPTTPRSIAIIFMRSPETGQSFIFSSNNVPSEGVLASLSTTSSPSFITGMLKNTASIPGRGSRTICIEPSGLVGKGHRKAIRLEDFSASPSAIKAVSNDQLREESAGTQC